MMDRPTQLALNRINQRFYAAIAHEWSTKRRWPWPGFTPLWDALLAAVRGSTRDASARVLDLGCGDGRFAQFLNDRRAGRSAPALRYLGVDASNALLEQARARNLGTDFRFEHADFVIDPMSELSAGRELDLIALLGVLHHIPGRMQRSELVRCLGQQLCEKGCLALTRWRLDEDDRFRSRVLSFEEHNRSALEPLALDQLEPGDTLLSWGDAGAPARYCHFPDDAELGSLIAASGLQLRARYRADGHQNRMNEYILLCRS